MIEVVLYRPGGKENSVQSEKSSLMIGKAAGNDILLDEEGVSRYHARLSIDGTELVLEDLGSTNGTYVNSKRVERCALTPKDKITIGATLLSAEFKDALEQGNDQQDAHPQFDWAKASLLEGSVATPSAKAPEKATEPAKPPEKQSESSRNASFYWKSLSSFLAPIWGHLNDDSVSEIMVNGPGETYIERKGELHAVGEVFNEDQLRAAVLNIAQYVGRNVSEAEPALDARLPDGSRVAVLLPPCSRKGISISIRKFSKEKLTIAKLIEFGALTEQMHVFLKAAVVLKKNIIVSGGTSSGKTSLLNVLSSLIPRNERIITIEDAAELQLNQDHILPMETKPPDKKGVGLVTIRDLLKVSLRMRPDRIIVGEIRGGEAIDLLQAMNTGHSGSMATLHASSPDQSLTRLETLSLFSGLEIPLRALREQVAHAVDIVLQVSRLPDHSRKVTHISEVRHLKEDGSYDVQNIFKFVRTGTNTEGKIVGKHEIAGYVPSFIDELELGGFTEAVALFKR